MISAEKWRPAQLWAQPSLPCARRGGAAAGPGGCLGPEGRGRSTRADGPPCTARPTDPYAALQEPRDQSVARPPPRRVLGQRGEAERRTLALELLHAELLAQEGERRGFADHPAVRAAERDALVETLLARDFAPDTREQETAPETSRELTPSLRRGIVLFANTRAEALAFHAPEGDLETWERLAGETAAPPGAPHPGGLEGMGRRGAARWRGGDGNGRETWYAHNHQVRVRGPVRGP